MSTSLVTHLILPLKTLSTSNELKVDEHNKHNELNKMHAPMVLYGYIIQAFRLPFMIQHSPSLLADDLNSYGRTTTARIQYQRTVTKSTTTTDTTSQGN